MGFEEKLKKLLEDDKVSKALKKLNKYASKHPHEAEDAATHVLENDILYKKAEAYLKEDKGLKYPNLSWAADSNVHPIQVICTEPSKTRFIKPLITLVIVGILVFGGLTFYEENYKERPLEDMSFITSTEVFDVCSDYDIAIGFEPVNAWDRTFICTADNPKVIVTQKETSISIHISPSAKTGEKFTLELYNSVYDVTVKKTFTIKNGMGINIISGSNSNSIEYGKSYTFTAMVDEFYKGYAIEWSVGNPNVTIQSSGLNVTLVASEGEYTGQAFELTAKIKGTEITKTKIIEVPLIIKNVYDVKLICNGSEVGKVSFDEDENFNTSMLNTYVSVDGCSLYGWSKYDVSNPYFTVESVNKFPEKLKSDLTLYAVLIPDKFNGYTPIASEKDFFNIGSNMHHNYYLMKDIYCSSENKSIGSTYNDYTAFKGILDGDGHTVYDMIIKNKGAVKYRSGMGSGGGNYAFTGVFSELGANAMVKNIIFSNLKVTAEKSCDGEWQTLGGIAGYSNGAKLDNIILDSSSISVPVEWKSKCIAGGLIGISEGNTVITDCIIRDGSSVFADGNDSYAGGIVGSMEHGNTTIMYCVCEANIESIAHGGAFDYRSSAAGGIAGISKFNGTKKISFCESTGTIKTDMNWGWRDSGGIIGKNETSANSTYISDCAMITSKLYEGGKKQGDCYVDGGSGDIEYSLNHIINMHERFTVYRWFGDSWNSDLIVVNGNSFEINM